MGGLEPVVVAVTAGGRYMEEGWHNGKVSL